MVDKVFVISVILSPFSMHAQSSADTTFHAEALKNTIGIYNQYVREHINLYNGYEYVRPVQTSDQEHPFFKFDDWTIGTIEYNDELFEGTPLLYDITKDKLVTEHYQNGNEVELIPEKVNRFTLADHTFEKIKNENVNNSLPRSGYYEVLYNGITKTVALRQKQKLETTSAGKTEISFTQRDRYFLLRNGKFFKVKSKGSMLKVLVDQKSQLKKFIKTQKLNFRQTPEISLARLAEFYDTLNQ